MKVLLLGEYSGFHRNLKDGLEVLGHEVQIASSGDGWKKISSDIDLGQIRSSNWSKWTRIGRALLHRQKLINNDIVHIINPYIFPRKWNFNDHFIRYLVRNNRRSFLMGAGDDAFYWQIARKKLEYGRFEDIVKYDAKNGKIRWMTQGAMQWNRELAEKVDGIIPFNYEYTIGYEGFENLRPTIPIPVNCEKIPYAPNRVKGKIVVFHGLNRYGAKGTRHVEKAFEILRKKYPNDLELVIDGGMPLDDYLHFLKRVNVVVDETFSHSWGMNAVYSMALGKVVLGGAEPEHMRAVRVRETPVVNILPDPHDIVNKIETVLEQRDRLEEWGQRSRCFVEEIHGHVKVARACAEQWNTD